MRAKGIDFGFKFVTFALVGNFYIAALFLGFLEPVRFADIDPTGYFRFIALGVIVVLLLAHLGRYLPLFSQERVLSFSIFFLLSLLVFQIFLVNDQSLHLQGSIQVFFYLICVLLSLYSCYYHGKSVRDVLVKLIVVLFISVIIFYPYVIYHIGMLPYERLRAYGLRPYFLLGAGNEDAHFMVTLSPVILAKLYRSRFITGMFLMFFSLAMVYNGTLTAIVMGVTVTILYYFLNSRKKVLLVVLIIMILLLVGGTILQALSVLFERQKVLIWSYEKLLRGEPLGENLSGRIGLVWLPAILYTIENSFWTGFGSNGWTMVANNTALVRIEGIVQAASPHNLFVWSFTNWGIVGLVLIICIFYKSVRYSWFCVRASGTSSERNIPNAIFCSWVAFIGWSMSANSHGPYGWTVFILLILLSIANKQHLIRGENR